ELFQIVDYNVDGVARDQANVENGGSIRGDNVAANSGLQNGGSDGVAHHGVPHGVGVGEEALGVFAAVGGVHDAHPLAGLLVFEGGEGFEIAADDGSEMDGRGVVADFVDGGGEVDDGVVLGGRGSVAALAGGGERDVHGNFFAGLESDVLDFAVFEDDLAAFVQGVT